MGKQPIGGRIGKSCADVQAAFQQMPLLPGQIHSPARPWAAVGAEIGNTFFVGANDGHKVIMLDISDEWLRQQHQALIVGSQNAGMQAKMLSSCHDVL